MVFNRCGFKTFSGNMAAKTRGQKKPDDSNTEDADSESTVLNELKALSAKMDLMQTSMNKQFTGEIKGLRNAMEKVISENQEKMKRDLDKAVSDMRANLDTEVGILCARMEQIELKMERNAIPAKRFEPDVSLIIVGLIQEENEDIEAKIRDLLEEGLQVHPMPELVAAERIQARGTKPGIVKVELKSSKEKVSVLRRKARLKDSERFKTVYVSSAKSHTERLVDLNFRTLLREMPAGLGKKFYVSANGRLVKRAPREDATATTEWN